MGKTSLPEYWDANHSQNHVILGHVEDWLYYAIAGIRTKSPGYEHIIIKPNTVDFITSATGNIETIRGKVSSSWKKNKNNFTLDVTIPFNSTADIYIPIRDISKSIITFENSLIWDKGIINDNILTVRYVKTEGLYVVFNIGSGNYTFISE